MNLHIRGFAESSPQPALTHHWHNSQLTFSRIQNKGNIFDSFNWNAPGPDSRLVHRFGDIPGMVSIFMLSRDITPVPGHHANTAHIS